MKKSVAWAGLLALLLMPGILSAQSRNKKLSHRPASTKSTQRRMSFSKELIYRRAFQRARQRLVRIETRKWLGRSASRPFVYAGYHSQGFHGVWNPNRGFYSAAWLKFYQP